MRMTRVAALVLGSMYGTLLVAASPQVVLIESDPWLMVIGSDSPAFVLYDDGAAIYRSDQGSPSGYVSSQLTPEQSKSLFAQVVTSAIVRLDSSYTLTEVTDQPTNTLVVWNAGQRKVVTAYGNLRKDKEIRAKAPPPFLTAFDALTSYSSSTQNPWVPKVIEVLLWPYEYSPETPAAWPAEWPPFSKATPRGAEGLIQVFLPGAELQNLQKFMATLKPKQAIAFGSTKWAISYRIPLPEEEKWSR